MRKRICSRRRQHVAVPAASRCPALLLVNIPSFAHRAARSVMVRTTADSDVLVIDGIQISAFARKAPAIKKSGDAGLDEQRTSERNALMKCVALLQQHDDLVLPTLSHIQGAITRKATTHKRERTWADTYCRVKYFPKYFLAAWLQQVVNMSTGCVVVVWSYSGVGLVRGGVGV